MQIPNNALPGLPSPFSQFTGKQFISEIDAIEAHPCVKTLLVICPPARLRGVTIDCVYSGDRLLDSDRPHHRPQHYDNMSADTQKYQTGASLSVQLTINIKHFCQNAPTNIGEGTRWHSLMTFCAKILAGTHVVTLAPSHYTLTSRGSVPWPPPPPCLHAPLVEAGP